jgi:beta-glucosidase
VVSKSGDKTTVKVTVTNTGKVQGAEVVQLYVGCPAAAEEPPKQLRGFDKVRLKPGEARTVTMTLDKDSLAAWDSDAHAFTVYPGAYSIMVGASSRDIRLTGSVTY